MKIVFSSQGWEDYLHWQKTDRKMLKRVNELIKEITRTPFEGAGKPEPLRHALAGCWSRRAGACATRKAISYHSPKS